MIKFFFYQAFCTLFIYCGNYDILSQLICQAISYPNTKVQNFQLQANKVLYTYNYYHFKDLSYNYVTSRLNLIQQCQEPNTFYIALDKDRILMFDQTGDEKVDTYQDYFAYKFEAGKGRMFENVSEPVNLAFFDYNYIVTIFQDSCSLYKDTLNLKQPKPFFPTSKSRFHLLDDTISNIDLPKEKILNDQESLLLMAIKMLKEYKTTDASFYYNRFSVLSKFSYSQSFKENITQFTLSQNMDLYENSVLALLLIYYTILTYEQNNFQAFNYAIYLEIKNQITKRFQYSKEVLSSVYDKQVEQKYRTGFMLKYYDTSVFDNKIDLKATSLVLLALGYASDITVDPVFITKDGIISQITNEIFNDNKFFIFNQTYQTPYTSQFTVSLVSFKPAIYQVHFVMSTKGEDDYGYCFLTDSFGYRYISYEQNYINFYKYMNSYDWWKIQFRIYYYQYIDNVSFKVYCYSKRSIYIGPIKFKFYSKV